MQLSAHCRFLFFLTFAALAAATLTGAQTLQHRPPPRPATPTAPATPATVAPEKPVLPRGFSLQVEITQHYPMKTGEVIEGKLLHPVYLAGRLVVPENTLLRGRVVALEPDTKTRWRGRLGGDFTPFYTPEVRFDELMLPHGALPIAAATAAHGAPVLHLTAPGVTPKRSFVARQWTQAKSNMHDRIAYFTAPGKGDRAKQMLYHQLPYHPQRIEAHTAWSFELTAPLALPDAPVTAPAPSQPVPATGKPGSWSIHALLTRELSSATARPGDAVQALVVEPVYDKDNQLVVPQGATLIGKVTSAKAARSFDRNGKLRFTFQQVHFPEGFGTPVEGLLAGAATEKAQNLSMDAEGSVSPRNQSSAIAPLILTMLAGRALGTDGNMYADSAVASNGFGIVGRIVGVAAGSRNLAAGIGFYAAGLSVYENFLHRGHDVYFPKDSRIEIETTPLRAQVLKPQSQ